MGKSRSKITVKEIKKMSENNNGFKKMVYPEPAKGSYIGAIERLFVGQTKTGKMALKICVRLFDGCDEAGRGFVESW